MSAPRTLPRALPSSLVSDLEEFKDYLVVCNYSERTVEKRLLVVTNALREWQTWDVRPSQVSTWLRRHSGWTATTYFHARCPFA